jgi:prepilin-type N-terminal cleavage/methylation domain-containing protein
MKKQRRQRGFSLIELLIAMAVVLILVSALVIAGSRSLRAANESSAGQNVSTLASNATAFQQSWQGFPPASTNLGGLEVASTTAATFAADQEVTTVEAAALAAGYVNGNYNILYKPGPTTFVDSAGNTVATTFEFTAVPINVSSGTKAYCSDPTGVFFNSLGTGATPSSGSGCTADGYISH